MVNGKQPANRRIDSEDLVMGIRFYSSGTLKTILKVQAITFAIKKQKRHTTLIPTIPHHFIQLPTNHEPYPIDLRHSEHPLN